MFTLSGVLVGSRDAKVGEKNTPIRYLQVMAGSDTRKELFTVKDFGLHDYALGEEVVIPCDVRAFVYKNGTAGLDLVHARDAQSSAPAKPVQDYKKAV